MPEQLRASAPPTDFDSDFYLKTYPDVALSGLDPARHFEQYGRLLGRIGAAGQKPAPVSVPVPVSAQAGAPAAARPAPALPETALPAPSDPAGLSPSSLSPALLDALYAQGPIADPGPQLHPELVTILLPSYNNAAWLARAIHSALSQHGVAIELIVVDDGSTDGSVALARRIAAGAGAGRMRVISLLRNFGCYYARNIGVMEAKGDYVTIIDSDDIMPPHRIARQLEALKETPGALASLAQLRRWNRDFTRPLNELRHTENTLLWRRSLVETLGYYDTVRYSADAEFRLRLQRSFGMQAVVRIPDELYFSRTLTNSLTTNPKSGVFALAGETFTIQISRPRHIYREAFAAWQKDTKPSTIGGASRMRIDFPLLERPFPLGELSQNASPSLGQRRVGTMASFPPRRDSLRAVIASILPQLDELILYLNDYPDLPEFTRDPKIRVVRSQKAAGDLRDNGKFYELPKADAYIFTLDDDLLYPPDYVARMIHQIEMLDRTSVVGVHGVVFPDGNFTRMSQRRVWKFAQGYQGSFVDLLGTGTTAWHISTLRPELSDFGSTGICDIWFAALAARKGVPLYSVPRHEGWLKEHIRFEERLYQETLDQPEIYFNTWKQVLGPLRRHEASRRQAERALLRGFDADTLAAAGFAPQAGWPLAFSPVGTGREVLLHPSPWPAEDAPPLKVAAGAPKPVLPGPAVRFHIVINGWNCRDYVDACLRSIAQQRPGPYDYEVTLIDDGSDDGTFEKLAGAAILPGARLIRVGRNAGPAHARHIGISAIRDPETVVVLVDMDDALEPDALRVVAQRYLDNPACLMTIGNWHDQDGKMNPQGFYSAAEIDGQKIRAVELFNATHLRSFRRKLYDALTEADLLDHEGRWLETCTDVALMYPLLDQCWSGEVEFITRPLYLYNRKHAGGTLARFGKPHKVERLAWLKSKPPKPRLNPAPPRKP